MGLPLLATVHSSGISLAVAVFLASAVEMVEALTIVVAVGVTRGWRTSLTGAVAAVLALGALVAAVGPAVVHLVPLNGLRVVVGVLLLYFGAQWLRKAVLRASGRKAKHDEDAIYARTVAELHDDEAAPRRDWTGMAVSFKGVFLEGVEVVVIVLTLGSASHDLSVAAIAAGAAALLVAAVGVVAARPLAKVPENAMKMTVGLMLVTFGTFWLGEGAGLDWPGSDTALFWLVAIYGGLAWVVVTVLRSRDKAPAVATEA